MKPVRVVRFSLWVNPLFDERLSKEPGIEYVVHPKPASDAQVYEALRGAHVYHCSSARDELPPAAFVTPELLSHLPELLCVSTYGAGYDSVEVDACTHAGVAVMNQAGANADSVAEHTLGLLLGVVHRLAESDRRLRVETGMTREGLMGHEIFGLTIGLVGIGHVGTKVAALAKAFGMRVLATDPYVPADEIRRRGAEPVSFDTLLEQSDVVSLHCPRDKDTRGMMNAAAYARMKKGSYFVTTARGAIHDEAALAEALKSGHIAGAGLDVWDREPPPLSNPLLALPNVMATFHTAGVTHEARRNIAVMGAEQIVQVVRGEKPPRLVNPEVWPRFKQRFAAALQS